MMDREEASRAIEEFVNAAVRTGKMDDAKATRAFLGAFVLMTELLGDIKRIADAQESLFGRIVHPGKTNHPS